MHFYVLEQIVVIESVLRSKWENVDKRARKELSRSKILKVFFEKSLFQFINLYSSSQTTAARSIKSTK